MSFAGMRQHSAMVNSRAGNNEMTPYGWFFGFSLAATLSFIAQWWWGNLFRRRPNQSKPKRNGDDNNKNNGKVNAAIATGDATSDTTTRPPARDDDENKPSSDDDENTTSRALETAPTTFSLPTTPQKQQPPAQPRDLQTAFATAAQDMSDNTSNLSVSTSDKLTLYGLYKQGTQGNAPHMNWSLSFQDQAKHQAWSQYRDLPREVAMLLYVELADRLIQENGSGSSSLDGGDDGGGLGAGVSSMPAVPQGKKAEDLSTTEQFITAAGDNDVATLSALLSSGSVADVNAPDEGGQTALHMAADAGAVDALNILLDHGASPTASDQYGISVLQAAVIAGHVAICKILMQRGADPDQPDSDGDTPRNCAVDDGSPEMRQIFRLGGSVKDRIVEEEEEEEEDSDEKNNAWDEASENAQKMAVSWDTEEGTEITDDVVIDRLPSS
mmetsp:Transcript_20236/g.43754  ORF Transcript_20236/g.43754 Transcript_20236/m.43754 type:complete len:441 (+) Transcript_20236:99-1421(+)